MVKLWGRICRARLYPGYAAFCAPDQWWFVPLYRDSRRWPKTSADLQVWTRIVFLPRAPGRAHSPLFAGVSAAGVTVAPVTGTSTNKCQAIDAIQRIYASDRTRMSCALDTIVQHFVYDDLRAVKILFVNQWQEQG